MRTKCSVVGECEDKDVGGGVTEACLGVAVLAHELVEEHALAQPICRESRGRRRSARARRREKEKRERTDTAELCGSDLRRVVLVPSARALCSGRVPPHLLLQPRGERVELLLRDHLLAVTVQHLVNIPVPVSSEGARGAAKVDEDGRSTHSLKRVWQISVRVTP